jgi:hypothetical protein
MQVECVGEVGDGGGTVGVAEADKKGGGTIH